MDKGAGLELTHLLLYKFYMGYVINIMYSNGIIIMLQTKQ